MCYDSRYLYTTKGGKMTGQIIITTIGVIALLIGLWTIKEMQEKQLKHKR